MIFCDVSEIKFVLPAKKIKIFSLKWKKSTILIIYFAHGQKVKFLKNILSQIKLGFLKLFNKSSKWTPELFRTFILDTLKNVKILVKMYENNFSSSIRQRQKF